MGPYQYPHQKIIFLALRKSYPAQNKSQILKCLFTPHFPLQPSTSHKRQSPPVPNMYMPYIEGPGMDWMVNDSFYHWIHKWCLKCENILECELAALPECQQCKKVIAWSRDCGMDQYVSWNVQPDELTLETIWGKYKEYCKPQSNEVHARFDLLTSFQQGNCSIDEWYNAVQAQVNLAKYPPRNSWNTPQGHLVFP